MNNQEFLDAANFILDILAEDTEANAPGAVLSTVLNETEQKTAEKNLVKSLKAIKKDKGVGVIGHGTTYIDNICKMHKALEQANPKEIVTLLKGSNRILQCGRGKGKAIVVLQREHIDMNELNHLIKAELLTVSDAEKTEVKNNEGIKLDVVGMLRHIEDKHRYLEKLNVELKDEVNVLTKAIEEKDAKITEIEKELQMKTIATWQ